MKKIIIAIDGYSSCGKSTVAKELARLLGYTYIDTGAMYRAIALYFLQHHIEEKEEEKVLEALDNIQLNFVNNSDSGMPEMYLNGVNVEEQIRGKEVAGKVSAVAALPMVRAFAVRQQQEMGKARGIVMDGRDIGTTVFPDAELKIFMTADPHIRAQRRYDELVAKNHPITFEEVYQNLKERDAIDSSRAVSPLRPAPDAIMLDNSHLSRPQQMERIMDWTQKIVK